MTRRASAPWRDASVDLFAPANGTAPLDASSGQQQRHRLSRAGNRRINRALHIMAIVQLRNPIEGRAHYDARKAARSVRLPGVLGLCQLGPGSLGDRVGQGALSLVRRVQVDQRGALAVVSQRLSGAGYPHRAALPNRSKRGRVTPWLSLRYAAQLGRELPRASHAEVLAQPYASMTGCAFSERLWDNELNGRSLARWNATWRTCWSTLTS
jgi:hypothetical protein